MSLASRGGEHVQACSDIQWMYRGRPERSCTGVSFAGKASKQLCRLVISHQFHCSIVKAPSAVVVPLCVCHIMTAAEQSTLVYDDGPELATYGRTSRSQNAFLQCHYPGARHLQKPYTGLSLEICECDFCLISHDSLPMRRAPFLGRVSSTSVPRRCQGLCSHTLAARTTACIACIQGPSFQAQLLRV